MKLKIQARFKKSIWSNRFFRFVCLLLCFFNHSLLAQINNYNYSGATQYQQNNFRNQRSAVNYVADSMTEYSWNQSTNDWYFTLGSSLEYDPVFCQLTKKTSYDRFGFPNTRTTYTIDDFGNTVSELTELYSGNEWLKRNYLTTDFYNPVPGVSYSKNYIFCTWNGFGWDTSTFYNYIRTFDAFGNYLTSISQQWNTVTHQLENINKQIFNFDTTHVLRCYTSYDFIGGNFVPVSRDTLYAWEYYHTNYDSRPDSSIIQYYNTGAWKDSVKITSHYFDADSYSAVHILKLKTDSVWTPSRLDSVSYNNIPTPYSNYHLGSSSYSYDGAMWVFESGFYANPVYDSNNHLQEETNWSSLGLTSHNDSHNYFFNYRSCDDIGKENKLSIVPMPCTDCIVRGDIDPSQISINDVLGRTISFSLHISSEGYRIILPNSLAGLFILRDNITGEAVKFIKL